jgi:hypothetical protein
MVKLDEMIRNANTRFKIVFSPQIVPSEWIVNTFLMSLSRLPGDSLSAIPGKSFIERKACADRSAFFFCFFQIMSKRQVSCDSLFQRHLMEVYVWERRKLRVKLFSGLLEAARQLRVQLGYTGLLGALFAEVLMSFWYQLGLWY